MNVEYIEVQAGGKGTRMKQMTYNKPKALVPINNLPMIFHLFRHFSEKKFIIIGDYKYEVLKQYLKAFAEVDYALINANGKQGTCAGIRDAINLIPENKAFMLIWSDLILSERYQFPEKDGNYVGISKGFSCRWKFENGSFKEEKSREYGGAGHFIFEDKLQIQEVPEEGEFVRWLSERKILFDTQDLTDTNEFGLAEDLSSLEVSKCRPFNRMIFQEDRVIKEPVDQQGKDLAVREIAWYEKIKNEGFRNIPIIYSTDPLVLERIRGKNIYEIDCSHEEKKKILKELISCLNKIHELEHSEVDEQSYYEAYIGKTFKRLEKVYDLVPFAHDKYITINNQKCLNVFFYKKELENEIIKFMPQKFELIHGDCTFSNMMLREDGSPVMIDPRGYFGTTELLGDPAYDWVKLYYSIVGNYDQFNLKRFTLKIEKDCVDLEIESNNWEDMEEDFFKLLEGKVSKYQMKLLHAIIYLSLTTYAWQDYDSICGAFYKGLLLLNEAIKEKN